MTVTKGWGFHISPIAFQIDTYPFSPKSPLFLRRRRRRLSSSCPSPTRPSSPTRRSAPPRHALSAISRRWRARPRRRPPSPTRISAPDAAHLPDAVPLPDSLPHPALIPPRRRPRPSSSAAELLQLVCRAAAADASACRPLSVAAGRRACALMAGRAAMGFCLADVSKHF
jgi:hypothetical protein